MTGSVFLPIAGGDGEAARRYCSVASPTQASA